MSVFRQTHNFCMRVSRAESTAWISAVVHVETTGCLFPWSCSATYCNTKTHPIWSWTEQNNWAVALLWKSLKAHLALPVGAADQHQALRQRRVRQQNLVELIVHGFPQNLQIHPNPQGLLSHLLTAEWLICTSIIHSITPRDHALTKSLFSILWDKFTKRAGWKTKATVFR